MAIQVGPHHRKKEQGGSGVLLGGVTGIAATRVLIIGGDVSGINEVRMAMVMEAKVAVLDRSLGRFAELDMPFVGQVNVLLSTVDAIVFHVIDAGLVVGAVLVPVAAAPKLVIEDIVRTMRPGSVIVDIAIDQGSCFETSKPTSHDAPNYKVHDVVHYCDTNIPVAVSPTSTFALNNATLPFTLAIAEQGYREALLMDPHLCMGLHMHRSAMT